MSADQEMSRRDFLKETFTRGGAIFIASATPGFMKRFEPKLQSEIPTATPEFITEVIAPTEVTRYELGEMDIDTFMQVAGSIDQNYTNAVSTQLTSLNSFETGEPWLRDNPNTVQSKIRVLLNKSGNINLVLGNTVNQTVFDTENNEQVTNPSLLFVYNNPQGLVDVGVVKADSNNNERVVMYPINTSSGVMALPIRYQESTSRVLGTVSLNDEGGVDQSPLLTAQVLNNGTNLRNIDNLDYIQRGLSVEENLVILGPTTEYNGITYIQVQTPDGSIGYVAGTEEFVIRSQIESAFFLPTLEVPQEVAGKIKEHFGLVELEGEALAFFERLPDSLKQDALAGKLKYNAERKGFENDQGWVWRSGFSNNENDNQDGWMVETDSYTYDGENFDTKFVLEMSPHGITNRSYHNGTFSELWNERLPKLMEASGIDKSAFAGKTIYFQFARTNGLDIDHALSNYKEYMQIFQTTLDKKVIIALQTEPLGSNSISARLYTPGEIVALDQIQSHNKDEYWISGAILYSLALISDKNYQNYGADVARTLGGDARTLGVVVPTLLDFDDLTRSLVELN